MRRARPTRGDGEPVKAGRGDIDRALAAPGKIRLFLLHGPDIAGSNALAARLTAALGPDVERVALAPASLKADPALLADEAASFSLFGGKRLIFVDSGGDELLDAVAALLDAPAGGNPVVIVTGALKKTSKLLALVEVSPHALANASYLPEGRDADRLAVEIGRAAGLAIPPDVARRLAESSGGDRALLASEIDKFALFLDADPERPATLEPEVVAALSADAEEGDLSRVVDAVLDGDMSALSRELTQLAGSGSEDVVLLRALSRRLLLLAKHRADVDAGSSVDSVMASAGKSMFYKDRPAVARQLGRWTADRLATAIERTIAAERNMKSTGSLGADAVHETLFGIAQAATRRR